MSGSNEDSEAAGAANLPPRSPNVRQGHRRQASNPSAPIGSIDMAQLERQWSTASTGLGLSTGYESFSGNFPAATRLPGSCGLAAPESPFHATWSNMGASSSLLSAVPLQTPVADGAATSIDHSLSQSITSMGSMSVSASQTTLASSAPDRPDALNASMSQFMSIDENVLTSKIHDEARVMSWSNVLTLCKSRPQDAGYVSPDGWTAIHHACNRRCDRADVVEALVRACPEALLDLEVETDMTPLHYACRFKAPKDAVRLLLHLYPQYGHLAVSKKDRKGRSPFWYAVRYEAPKGVVEMLLEIDPSVALEEDKAGESPLSLVWDTWAEKSDGKKTLGKFINAHTEGEEAPTKSPEETKSMLLALLEHDDNKKLKSKWATAILFLKAHFGFPLSTEGTTMEARRRTFRILHATASIRCHSTLFLVAKALYPEQASELDSNDLRQQEGAGNQTALHLATMSCATGELSRSVLTALLELYPQAAQTPSEHDGSLPLHKLVENDHKNHFIHDGIRDVYQAYPAALNHADSNGLLPLHRAAAANKSGGGEGGSVILQLVELRTEAANVADSSGRLPLHYVAEHGEGWEDEAQAIHHAFEAAVRSRAGMSVENRLPLHLAAASPDARRTMLEKLVELHPRGALQADRLGKLPLHLACESGKEWDKGISCIYEAFEGAIQQPEQNTRQWVALQIAAASPSSSGAVVTQLAELFPEAASLLDSAGKSALHLACESGREWENGLQAIFEAHPFANMTADKQGLLPFHVAALRYCLQQDMNSTTSNDHRDEGEEDDVPDRTEFLARTRSTSITEAPPPTPTDADASKLEVLYQLLIADPTILPKY